MLSHASDAINYNCLSINMEGGCAPQLCHYLDTNRSKSTVTVESESNLVIHPSDDETFMVAKGAAEVYQLAKVREMQSCYG